MDEVITDHDLKIATQGAASAYRSGRGVVDKDDLIGEAYLWLAKNKAKVNRWHDEGKHGDNKIRHAVRLHCLRVVSDERRKQSRLMRGDLFYYPMALVREILPDVYDREDWFGQRGEPADKVRGTSRPSEGNNRLAMIIDVQSCLKRLPESDQALLADLYQDGGVGFDVVAATAGVSSRTIRRREERAIERIVEMLGGEPPYGRVS